tara:strand:- start:248 stop:463 length:216 start_codon:yes stop_codon:yes gene_type:complete
LRAHCQRAVEAREKSLDAAVGEGALHANDGLGTVQTTAATEMPLPFTSCLAAEDGRQGTICVTHEIQTKLS